MIFSNRENSMVSFLRSLSHVGEDFGKLAHQSLVLSSLVFTSKNRPGLGSDKKKHQSQWGIVSCAEFKYPWRDISMHIKSIYWNCSVNLDSNESIIFFSVMIWTSVGFLEINK